MSKLSRRHFLQSGAAAVGLMAGQPQLFASETHKKARSATDWVTLGKSGIKVTRLGFGTGSMGGRHQRELGQKKFTELVRHAYERGIRFFDTADNYNEMHEMLAEALKGIPRDTYTIQTKMKIRQGKVPAEEIDRFRRELNSDYFDSFLLHCAQSGDWTEELKPLMEGLDKAKDKESIRTHGASVHGLKPLKAMPGCEWLDVALLRVNHNGTHMDGLTGKWAEPSKPDEAIPEIKKIHAQGTGVIGMKIIGNGEFTSPEQRDASIKYVMGLDCVDAVVIGFKHPKEIDEAIERMNTHLNA